jgi:ADP-ribose pyrophosphatase YjhB (NUDIX family)
MITFSKSDRRFNFRVAGIAIDDDYVLLYRAERDSFWTFPGGRAEINETSA